MLHDEFGLHAELGTFLDGERLLLEVFKSARSGQVDGEVRATFDFEG